MHNQQTIKRQLITQPVIYKIKILFIDTFYENAFIEQGNWQQ